jgi:hypothetical protein
LEIPGIHKYQNLNDLIDDVKEEKYEAAVKKNGATQKDYKNLEYCEYKKPEFGSGPKEFITNIINKNN